MRIKDRMRKHGRKGLEHYPITVPVPARLARQMAADRYRYIRHHRRGWIDIQRIAGADNPFRRRAKAVKRAMKNLSLLKMLAGAGWLRGSA